MVRLGDVATIDRQTVDPTTLLEETTYIGLEHIERGGRLLGSSTIAESRVKSAKFRFSADHLLYGKLRPNLAKVARPGVGGVCSTDILPVLPGPAIDRAFLTWYLLQPSMVSYAATRTAGANLPRLSPTVLAGFPVPLPGVDEQRRIAAILDAADAVRSKCRQVRSKLESVGRAIFTEMFDHISAPRVPLTDVIRSAQIGLSRSGAESGLGREYPYMKMDAITPDGRLVRSKFTRVDASVSELATYSLLDGDLVFNTRNSRENVGKSAIFRGESAIFNNNLMRIRLSSNLLPPVFHAWLYSRDGREQLARIRSGTTNVVAIYAKDLMRLEVAVPPIGLQQAFAAKVEAINAQRDAVERALAADDALFASLQSRAFRGEL